jgi:hypothetical protein
MQPAPSDTDVSATATARLRVPFRVCVPSGLRRGRAHPSPGVSRRRLLVVLATVLTALAFTTAPAFAKQVHAYTTSFGKEGSGPGEFVDPTAVAVNEETGDVYVLDRGNDRVEQFAFDATTKAYEYEDEFNGSGLNLNEGVNKPPTGQFARRNRDRQRSFESLLRGCVRGGQRQRSDRQVQLDRDVSRADRGA